MKDSSRIDLLHAASVNAHLEVAFPLLEESGLADFNSHRGSEGKLRSLMPTKWIVCGLHRTRQYGTGLMTLPLKSGTYLEAPKNAPVVMGHLAFFFTIPPSDGGSDLNPQSMYS